MTTMSTSTVAIIRPRERKIKATTDFDALFRAHQAQLVHALTLVAGDRELAADAVQEAFVKAHLNWRRISGYDDPVGWIRRVAINRLRDEHRRTRRKRRALDRLSTERATTNDPLSDSIPDRELMCVLAELPRRQRLCVALRYVEDLGTAQIARTLNVSEGTVKSNLSNARARLRMQLDRPPGTPE